MCTGLFRLARFLANACENNSALTFCIPSVLECRLDIWVKKSLTAAAAAVATTANTHSSSSRALPCGTNQT